jgi:hypothetical protein
VLDYYNFAINTFDDWSDDVFLMLWTILKKINWIRPNPISQKICLQSIDVN